VALKKKPGLSASATKDFIGCPRKYRYRHVDKIDTGGAKNLVLGNCFHEALEFNYAQKVSSGEDRPAEEVVQRFRDRWMAQADTIEDFGPHETIGSVLDLGCRMVTVHHREIAPTVTPLFVEKSFRISLGEGFPFDLTGRWDLIDADSIVIDNKSYGKAPKQEWVDRDLQMDIYSLAYRLQFKECENGLRIDAVTKWRHPQVVQVYTHRTNEDAAWLLGQLEGVAKAILAGIDYPIRDSNLCSPLYCGYWDRCKKERSY
jgi:hypothetical protein